MITFNQNIKLILADVDETIADVYTSATSEMVNQLTLLLQSGRVLFMVTGAGLGSVKERIVDQINPKLRNKIMIAHCSGAEIVGFDQNGEILTPYYSAYSKKMNSEEQMAWRSVVNQVVAQYQLITVTPQKVGDFKDRFGDDPLTVMLADRGPQITLEFVNGYKITPEQYQELKHTFPNLKPSDGYYDLREPVMDSFNKHLKNANLPVSAHLAGVFALDLVLDGVSKTEALRYLLSQDNILSNYNLPLNISDSPDLVEIWGDKFTKNGGSDRKMCLAVDHRTRAIDFRQESLDELGNEFNIVVWDGDKHLHEGLLEYLKRSSIA